MADTAAGAPGETSQGVREFTWPDYIGWGWMIVQARLEADWTGLWDYAMPNPKASEETVARTEAQLGFRLPESYRGFLLASNGWPYFFQDMSIFSTSDLLGGEVMQRYDDFLDYYLSMMELNKLDIARLRRDDGPKPDGVPHAVIDRPGSPPVFEHARRNDL